MAMATTSSYNHRDVIIDGILSTYQQKKFTDVTVTSTYQGQTHSVEGHRMILAAVSEYFAEKLSCDGVHDLNIIDFMDIHPVVLSESVKFIYTGTCTVDREHLEGLLLVAKLWKLEGLKLECFRWMVDEIQHDNVSEFYELALTNDESEDVRSVFENHIRGNFNLLHKNNNLNALSLNGFSEILAKNCSTKLDGKAVYDAIVQWHTKHAEDDMSVLLAFVNFDDIDHDDLVAILPNLAIGGYVEIVKNVQTVIKSQWKPNELLEKQQKEIQALQLEIQKQRIHFQDEKLKQMQQFQEEEEKQEHQYEEEKRKQKRQFEAEKQNLEQYVEHQLQQQRLDLKRNFEQEKQKLECEKQILIYKNSRRCLATYK